MYEATFPSGSTVNGNVACDTITIIDDDVLEGTHDFGFTIGGTSLAVQPPPPALMQRIMFFGELTSVDIEDDESKYLCLQSINGILSPRLQLTMWSA